MPNAMEGLLGEMADKGYFPVPVAAYGKFAAGTKVETRITDPVTGGQKNTKPERYDLLPWGFATDEIARVYGFGSSKYSDHNWRRGYRWGLSIAALLRHIFLWVRGETNDQESGLSHLAHAAFHLLTLMTYQNEHLGTDDRAVTTLLEKETV